ncbi:MAG: HEAT repeat domain-containing protein [Phycisphaerae bacterium]
MPTRPGAGPRLVVLVAAVCVTLAGCTDTNPGWRMRRVFKPIRSPQESMRLALSSTDADERREAVAHVADSRSFDADWAIEGFAAIAQLESDASARCIAIRALARSGSQKAAETIIGVLAARPTPEGPLTVRPPDELTRGDATLALAELSAGAAAEAPWRAAAHALFLDLLKDDRNRAARIAAARGLGEYPLPETVSALVAALRDRDFAVVHAAEASLVRLTGETHECNPIAWEAWASAHQGRLFEGAGRIPESRRPPYDNRFEQAGYEVKQWFGSVFPAAKGQ